MKRVQQTLAPLLVNGTPRPVILPDLCEVDFGDWTGLAWEEVPAKFGVSAFAWLEQLECDGIANAESAEILRDRVEPCLRQILADHSGQQVAIFCHGGIIRVLLSIVLRWPLSRLGAFEIAYASVTQVALLPERAELQLLNFTPWRETA
jgi:broad specificity phosphatase PhoE